MIKKETFDRIKKTSDHEKIESLSFSAAEYREGKIVQRINLREIKYLGRMYDIVKEVKSGFIITFYCIHDEKEDKLEKSFSENVGRNADTENSMQIKYPVNQEVQFLEGPHQLNTPTPPAKNIFPAFTLSELCKKFIKVPSPPPKPLRA